jgi:hypothetical protein
MSIASVGQQDTPATIPQPGGNATQYKKTSIESTQTAEIEIYTAEGDKVTLSASAAVAVTSESSGSYAHLGRSHGSHHRSHHHRNAGESGLPQSSQDTPAASETSASVSSMQKFSVSVEGNLNPQELQDIHKALETIQQASTKMQSGNLDGAQNKLEKLGNLESLSGISANITTQKSITVETGSITQSAA